MTDADRTELLETLKIAEGWSGRAYRDSVGILTIGYGRNLEAMTISRGLGAAWLKDDLANAEVECRAAWPWFDTLSSRRQAVVIELNFNLGMTRLRGFTRMLTALGRGDFDAAAAEMLDSRWREQVGARAVRLATTLRRG